MKEQERKIFDLIIRDVAELPDRTSPDDWPEAMIVTVEELRTILTERLSGANETAAASAVHKLSCEQCGGLYGPSNNLCEEGQQLHKDAMNAAIWVTASPHEWTWTHEQQVAMARYCVEASSKLALWDWLTEMHCTVQANSDVNGPRWCVLDVDNEVIGGGDTPLEAIQNAKEQP